ncbi:MULTISPECIES: glycosyltransferase [unclassified Nonomuraea]|uniref:glycosyltransferase n=1 Tax=unclassified Nonomuraea TaxID=2593643 RepID=UPI001378BD6C|nr:MULTISPECIES: nucleotide disphospho-sugar-binding domain-containing protein [unclassified Nonomuraea]NBE96647.1 glycosyltransferase [Nonomuraea sp. K271]
MARVLFAATPFHGHVTPLLTVAKEMKARGHDVLFLTGARFAAAVESGGLRFEALPEEADFDDRRMSAAFPEFAETGTGYDHHIFFWKRVFADAAVAQYRRIQTLLEHFPATALVHDTVFLGALPLSLRPPDGVRPATICLGVLPPMLLSDDVPPFGPGIPYLAGPEGRERNRRLNAETLEAYAGLQKDVVSVFAAIGCDLPGFVFDCAVVGPDHYLQLTVPGFEYPRSDAPASFRCVGALPQPSSESFAPPRWWPEVTAADRPVVAVTQGTLANEDLSELILPTVRGLAATDVTVVAVTARPDGPEDFARLLSDLPANAVVAGYVPFDRLLRSASVLVTNGGYGGVHAALQNGVPLVVAGDTEDKPEVAARVQWSGTGIDLRTGRPEPEQVRQAVVAVLGDAGHRAAAGRLRAEIAAFDPFGTVAGIVAGTTTGTTTGTSPAREQAAVPPWGHR